MQSHHINSITNAVIKRMMAEGKSLAEIQDAVHVLPDVVAAWVAAIKAKSPEFAESVGSGPRPDPIDAVAPVEPAPVAAVPVKVRKSKK